MHLATTQPHGKQAGLKARLYSILENPDDTSRAACYFNFGMMGLITLNVLAIVLETVPELYDRYGSFFHGFELFSIAIFTVEYGVRLWAATAGEQFRHPVNGRLRYALTPLAFIDLLAIAPFFLALIFPLHLSVTRAFRFVRLMRLLKLTRYASPLQTLGVVLKDRRDQLVVCLFIVLLMLLFAASTVYVVENPVQPDIFSSIPASMWWGVATLTTVGYGDAYPITPVGRILGGVIAILGVGMFALPAGILASGFAEELERQRTNHSAKKTQTCPHCGRQILGDETTPPAPRGRLSPDRGGR
jgi:voltage-gated potassium channel